MHESFRIKCRKSGGNLHIYPKGILDGSSACQLVNLINEKYNGKGRVFINTDQIKEMLPFGAAVFRSGMTESGLPRVSFFFKGEKAFKMAPNGCKVIAKKKRESCRHPLDLTASNVGPRLAGPRRRAQWPALWWKPG